MLRHDCVCWNDGQSYLIRFDLLSDAPSRHFLTGRNGFDTLTAVKKRIARKHPGSYLKGDGGTTQPASSFLLVSHCRLLFGLKWCHDSNKAQVHAQVHLVPDVNIYTDAFSKHNERTR